MQVKHARISAVGYALPKQTLDNAALSRLFPEWSEKRIEDKTGIRVRRISAQNETALDLGILAASRMLKDSPDLRERIDALFFCTQTPDFCLPPNACIAQEKLGLHTSIAAFDYNLGCSGWVYGLSMAQAYIAAGQASCILCITAETYSKWLAEKDKGVKTIFGDAAAATIVESSENPAVRGFVFSTDGKGYSNLIVPASGAAKSKPLCGEPQFNADGRSPANLYMNGPAIFQFTLECVPELLTKCLAKENTKIEDIDYFIFHQANSFMLSHLRVKCNIPEDKFIIDMKDVGNTVSSTIPIALKNALDSGRITPGDTVFVAGFGVGYSAAACILTV